MRGRLGSEAPQDQVVVYVMLRVPDRYVLEPTTVCAQDVVGPGANLPDAPVYGPCTAILQPWLVPWEELATHVFQALLRQGYCNPLVPLPALWCGKVGVEISNHHQRSTPRGSLLMAMITSSMVEALSWAK